MRAEGAARRDEPKSAARTRWRAARPVVLLLLGGLSLYVILPSLLSVFGSWRSLSHLEWPFAILGVACVVASFVSLWELERIALGTRRWFPVSPRS